MMKNRKKYSNNLIARYQMDERLSNRQLAERLGASVGKTCAARNVRCAPHKQVETLAAYEGISVLEFCERYSDKCA